MTIEANLTEEIQTSLDEKIICVKQLSQNGFRLPEDMIYRHNAQGTCQDCCSDERNIYCAGYRPMKIYTFYVRD